MMHGTIVALIVLSRIIVRFVGIMTVNSMCGIDIAACHRMGGFNRMH